MTYKFLDLDKNEQIIQITSTNNAVSGYYSSYSNTYVFALTNLGRVFKYDAKQSEWRFCY